MGANSRDDTSAPMAFVSWRRSLLGVPLRNEAAGVVEEGDTLRVSVARRRPRWLLPPISWVIRPRSEKTLQLDPLGTEVWRLCDGTRTIEKIVDEFAENHRLTFHEARVSVTSYVKQLMQRGALVIAADEDEEDEETPRGRPGETSAGQ